MHLTRSRCILMCGMAILFSVVSVMTCYALMIEYNLDRLVRESDNIVVGKVTQTQSHWNDQKTKIVTDVTVEVGEDLKGTAEKTVVVQIAGGTVMNPDGTGFGYGESDTPRFEAKEEVCVFLNKATGAKAFKVTANVQGKFRVERDSKGKASIQSAPMTLVRAESKKIQDVKEFKTSLDDFKTQIKQVVKDQAAKQPAKKDAK